MSTSFRKKWDLQKRCEESQKVKTKYPDRIPIIVEVGKNNNDLILDKQKYLVPQDLTVGQFMYVIRKKLKLSPEKALFMFFEKDQKPCIIAHNTDPISVVYEKYQNLDGFLYATISQENVFGVFFNFAK